MAKIDIPVEKNEIINMTIDDIGTSGEGIGRYKGYTLFVDGGLPSEEIEVKVIKTGKNFGFGKLTHIIKPSKDRVEPICPVARSCGGCQLQHMAYDAQLAYKTSKVKEVLKRIGKIDGIESKVRDTIGMENPFNYRNKVSYPVRSDKGINKIGFYAKGSHRVVEHERCYIQHEKNEVIMAVVKEWMISHGLAPYDETTGKGMIRNIMTRYSTNLDAFHVTIVSNKRKLKYLDILIEQLTKLEYIDGISICINLEKTNFVLGEEVRLLWGNMYLAETIGAFKYEISPKSFFQINPIQTRVLYENAVRMADLKSEDTLMDLYCGIGSMTIMMAPKVKSAIGVELVEAAVEDAHRNQELNQLDNIDFYIGAAEDVIPHLYETKGIHADVVVVDPPRKGCDEALLKTIAEMKPDRVVYVSCDPATLARDLHYLTENGYQVEEVQPVDMFPHSVHVECVVGLSLI